MASKRLPLLSLAPTSVVFVTAMVYAGCHRSKEAPRPPVAVRAETVTTTAQAKTARYSGTVVANTQVDLAFKVPGYVHALALVKDGKAVAEKRKGRPLQAGDHVTRDMVLATLRKADFKQRYSELASMSAEASAGYRKSKLDYDRARKLFSDGVISQAELDAAKSRFEGVSGSAGAAAARAGQAELALSDSQLKSPLDGIVLDRRIEVGALVAPGMPAFVLADTSKVKVVFGVPDIVQRTTEPGQEVTITADALPDRSFPALITKVAAQADPKSRIFDIEATLDNTDGAFKVGMIATIQLGRAQDTPSMLVPLSAIVRMPGAQQGFAVFVLAPFRAETVARPRAIELGNLVGNRVSVTRGLSPGEAVVVQGATLLNDGDFVNVVPGQASGPSEGVASVPSATPTPSIGGGLPR